MMVETKRGKGDFWNIASNPKTQTLLIASHCVLLSMFVFYVLDTLVYGTYK